MKKILLFLILGVFLINPIIALDNQGIGTQGKNFTFIQTCDDATYITLSTIQYPNRSVETINTNMTSLGGGAFQYNFTDTVIGRHDVTGISDGCEKTFATYFEVTNSGFGINEANSNTLNLTIIFFMVLSVLLFINFMIIKDNPQVKWTSFLIGFIFMLTALNLISLVLLDSLVSSSITNFINSFTSISFYLYWFAFGLLAVIWFITILNTILFRQKLKKEKMFGLPPS